MTTDQSQTSPTTDLSPTPGEPLTEEQVLALYGPTLWDAMVAFSQDPHYFRQMAEAANLIVWKRDLWSARKEAERRGAERDEVQDVALQILAERGIEPPPTSRTRR